MVDHEPVASWRDAVHEKATERIRGTESPSAFYLNERSRKWLPVKAVHCNALEECELRRLGGGCDRSGLRRRRFGDRRGFGWWFGPRGQLRHHRTGGGGEEHPEERCGQSKQTHE